MDIFQDVNATICSRESLSSIDTKMLSELLSSNGGKYYHSFLNQITHLICSEKDAGSLRIKKAVNEGLMVVTEDWILDSIDSETKMEESYYHPKFLSLEEETLQFKTKPKSSSSASSSKKMPNNSFAIEDEEDDEDEEEFNQNWKTKLEDYDDEEEDVLEEDFQQKKASPFKKGFSLAKHSISPKDESDWSPVGPRLRSYYPGKKGVEKYSPHHSLQFPEENYEILRTDILQMTSFNENKNKYYCLELHRASNLYRVFTHYGRTGDLMSNPNSGRKECRYCIDLHDARFVYQSLYLEKTSNRKGYKLLDISSSNVGSELAKREKENKNKQKNSSSVSNLHPAVQDLIDHIYKEASNAITNVVQAKITQNGIFNSFF